MEKTFPIDTVSKAMRAVGDYYRQQFKVNPVPTDWPGFKSRFDEIEKRVLRELQEGLRDAFPDTPWECGEFDFGEQTASPRISDFWLCDSMDGAIQYMQQLPGWTINLVLMRQGKPFFAAIYEPLERELFWAIAGQGAYLNDTQIAPSKKVDPQLLLVTFDHPPFANKIVGLNTRIGDTVAELIGRFGTVRNYGPHGLQIASVAAGRIDVFCQEGLDTYNWLPGILIAQEAGATVATTQGETWQWGDDSLFVSSPVVAKEFFASKKAANV